MVHDYGHLGQRYMIWNPSLILPVLCPQATYFNVLSLSSDGCSDSNCPHPWTQTDGRNPTRTTAAWTVPILALIPTPQETPHLRQTRKTGHPTEKENK